MSEVGPNRPSTILNPTTNCRQLAEAVLETVADSVLLPDANLRVVFANASFIRSFRVGADEIVGHTLFEVGSGTWDTPELRRLINAVLQFRRTAQCPSTVNLLQGGIKAVRVTATSDRDR